MNFFESGWQLHDLSEQHQFDAIFAGIRSQQDDSHIFNLPIQQHPQHENIDIPPNEQIVSTKLISFDNSKPKLRSRDCHQTQLNMIGVKPKDEKPKRKRIIKPSPYHNFQKHLNIAVKFMLTPLLETALAHSPTEICILASKLWEVFARSHASTKKILHFIFNQFNEYLIKENELRQMGFAIIYNENSRQNLGRAKKYLTQLALQHLTDGNIDSYLQTRRIKNRLKFKRYIVLFRKELEDGFIKKRFTNRSRKEQMKKQFWNRNKE